MKRFYIVALFFVSYAYPLFDAPPLHTTRFLHTQESEQYLHTRCFEEKIDAYVERQIDLIHLSNVYSRSRESGIIDEIIEVLTGIAANTHADQLYHATGRMQVLLAELLESNTISDPDLSCMHEKLACFAAVKASMAYGCMLRNALFGVLHVLDEYIAYWEVRKHHPMYRILHTSPRAWFDGSMHYDRVKEHLKLLYTSRRRHFALLGQLMRFINRFNPHDTYASHDAWVVDLATFAQSMMVHENEEYVPVTSREGCLAALHKLSRATPRYQAHMLAHIVSAKKPKHYARYWMGYSVCGVLGLVSISSLIKNYAKVPLALNALRGKIRKSIVEPIDGLTVFLFHDRSKEEQEIAERKARVRSEREKWVARALSVVKKYNPDFTTDEEADLRTKSISDIITYMMYNTKSAFEGLRDEQNQAGGKGWGDTLWWPVQAIKNSCTGIAMTGASEKDIQEWLMSGPLKNIKPHLFEGYDISRLLVEGAKIEFWDDWLLDVKAVAERKHRMNKFTLALAESLPVYACFGGIGLLARVVLSDKANYKQVRRIIKRVHDMLIEATYHEKMGDHRYGALVYLMHKLRKQARYVSEHMREDFLHDIVRLEAYNLSAQTKLQCINNMRHYYPFLSVTP